MTKIIKGFESAAENCVAYAEGDDGERMPACKFTFDDETVYDGFSHGSTWNGFDNVAVTKETLDELMRRCAADNDADTLRDYGSIDPMNNGLYSLGWCFATSIVTDLAKLADDYAKKIGRA